MKVLALNGSPRMKASSTQHMLVPFLKGMEEAGAETEILQLRRLNLKQCIGCFSCWLRTPGKCIHNDGMNDILASKFCAADLVVFGTPLYHFTMSGLMKTFIDRTLPKYQPWLVEDPKFSHLSSHPIRFDGPKKMFLVSGCGFPEFEHYDSLVRYFKHYARAESIEYLGEILRPQAELLSVKGFENDLEEFTDNLTEAGKALIAQGSIPADLQDELRKPFFELKQEQFREFSDAYWQARLDRNKVGEEERHVAPLPAKAINDVEAEPASEAGEDVRIDSLLRQMADMYNAAIFPTLRCCIQFHFTDALADETADWFLEIIEDHCQPHMGRTPFPTLSISTTKALWQDIGQGRVNPERAFEDGEYEVDDTGGLLQHMTRLFNYPRT